MVEPNNKDEPVAPLEAEKAPVTDFSQDQLLEKIDALKAFEKKSQGESSKTVEPKPQTPIAPGKNIVGVDLGTSRIVSICQKKNGQFESKLELNSFYTVPNSDVVKKMLDKTNMAFRELGDQVAVLGQAAREFMAFLDGEMHRPMKAGLLSPAEEEAVPMIKEIILSVVGKPESPEDSLCFSVPAPRPGFESDLVYHRGIFHKFFTGLGYKAISMTEGSAVVLSELSEDNYTGIGISMGAGMCNVCFSFLSVPVLVYSISKGGDDIDTSVARVTNESVGRVCLAKEESLDLDKSPQNKMEDALHIFYEDLMQSLIKSLSSIFMQAQAKNTPKIKNALPIVIAGGTCRVPGFLNKFQQLLAQTPLSVGISNVRLASDPLRATARGCLIHASVAK